MPIELILLQDMEYLGHIGDRVQVADGYARNYLIPKGLAARYTSGVMKQIEARRRKMEANHNLEVANTKACLSKLKDLTLTFSTKTDENAKLYGSISARKIAEALNEKDIHVTAKNISLAEPIRKLGMYTVEVQLAPEMKENVRLCVIEEK